jgi:hypothetical protein
LLCLLAASAGLLFGLLLDHEDGGCMFTHNIGWLAPNYTAFQTLRLFIATAVRTSNPTSVPTIQYVFKFFVTVILICYSICKYFNFATFSKHVLATFMPLFCAVFWWLECALTHCVVFWVVTSLQFVGPYQLPHYMVTCQKITIHVLWIFAAVNPSNPNLFSCPCVYFDIRLFACRCCVYFCFSITN